MRLISLHLLDFKNYADSKIELKGNIHCLLGKNGSGKTNLLEAIHYLSLTKGTQTNDSANILHGKEEFAISGIFEKNEKKSEVICRYSIHQKKRISENGKDYKRFSEHLGKYPIVLVAPGDIEIIWNGSEVRRRSFDTLLGQIDAEYLANLIQYQAHMTQRNSLLRMVAEGSALDKDLLESYDEKVVISGTVLFRKRSEFVKEYLPFVRKYYEFLVGGNDEKVGMTHQSDLEQIDFKKELAANLQRDLGAGRTTIGIHRDDFLFTLNGFELRRYGSQGQQKSFLIALKLAEFDYLSLKKGAKPLILLDDIFDKLDDDRINRLLKLITEEKFAQIFITDARPERSREILESLGKKVQYLIIKRGEIEQP